MAIRRLLFLSLVAIIITMFHFEKVVVANEGVSQEDELHSNWAEILQKYVIGGRVDYYGIQQDEKQLQVYLDNISDVQVGQLSRDAQLALYINAYNACTVKLILDEIEDGEIVDSIKDIGGFFTSPWDIPFCKVGGEVLTLNNIEHDIIRPKFQDNRIHFAVNCASNSCPKLYSTAFLPSILDSQLEEATISFLNDKKSNYIKGKALYLSRIFKWYGEDFSNDPVSFYLKKTQNVEDSSTLKVKYLAYDWSLNIVN